MKSCRVCAQPLLWGGDKLRGVHPGCELRAPHAEPVEGPPGDPEHGGSPAVAPPPPAAPTEPQEEPPCSRS